MLGLRLVCTSVLHWAISVPATLGKDALSTGGRPTSIVGYPTNVGYPTFVG